MTAALHVRVTARPPAKDEDGHWHDTLQRGVATGLAGALPVLLAQVGSPNLEVRSRVVGTVRVLGWTAGSALPGLRALAHWRIGALAQGGPESQRHTATLAIDGVRGRYERGARSPLRK